MAEKTKKSIFDRQYSRIVLALLSAILSTAILAVSSMTIVTIYTNSPEAAPQYLIWIFVLLGLTSIVVFLKKRTKINLIRCITMFAFNVTLGIIVLFAKSNPYLFSLTAGLYCVSILVSRVFSIVQNHKIRNIIFNAIVIALFFFLAIGLFLPTSTENELLAVITVECIFVAVTAFIEAATIAFANLKVKVLIKIVVNTYSLEVLFGLLTMIVCFSLVFMMIEPDMPTFVDGLWYSFAVVTTIGFGDITAVTPIGRILTVVLGLYGLIVVAVITSIIVNFYNETAGKKDQKELKEIQKEEENKR